MQRRTFLARSVIGSGALVLPPVTAGCGAALGPRTPDSQELLARLERGLSTIRGVPSSEFARALRDQPRPELSEHILRLTLESLVVADVARSVPEGAVMPRAFDHRLMQELPVIEQSTVTHHSLLTRMPPVARRRLDARVRERPDIPMDVAGWIDAHAANLGVSLDSRMRLRNAATSAGARMRRQSANAVIDDCVSKVERVVAHSGSPVALARSRSTAAMIDAIWQQLDEIPGSGGLASSLSAPNGEDEDAEWARAIKRSEAPQWSARWGRPGDEEVEIGAIMMPFGLVTCGLLLIVGLIVLIAGVAQNADWDGSPRGA